MLRYFCRASIGDNGQQGPRHGPFDKPFRFAYNVLYTDTITPIAVFDVASGEWFFDARFDDPAKPYSILDLWAEV